MELIASEFARFRIKTEEDLNKMKEKIKEQVQKHAKDMEEIQKHAKDVGKHVVSPPAATDAGTFEEELIKTHFTEDLGLEGVPEEQRNMMMKSVVKFLAKMVNNGGEPEKQQEEEEENGATSDDDELREAKEGDKDDGFQLGREERKRKRKEARERASKAGLMMVDPTNTVRPAAEKAKAADAAHDEPQARKKQDASIDVVAKGDI